MSTPELRILLIEDSSSDALLVKEALLEAGLHSLELTHAERLDEALDRIHDALFDVVVVDLGLPDCAGLETYRRIQERAPDTAVLVLTGLADEVLAARALAEGAQDYLVKNELNPRELRRAVQYAVERKRAEDARQRLEEELYRARKLESIGQLAAGVAHDLNNVLTAIFGYLELARMNLPPEHVARQDLVHLDTAAQHAAGITKALLSFSRQIPGEKKPLRLYDHVRGAYAFLRHLLPATVELKVSPPPTEEVWVQADMTQLQQVLTNLALNARDAMPQGGTLSVRVETGADDAPGPAGASVVQLVVADTGTGMPPDVQARVFDPFFTTKPRERGTGLGLSIVLGIVQDHGGRIEVASTPGRGTTFTITLPRIPAGEAQPAAVASSVPACGAGELILLAEDQAHVRTFMETLLRAKGCEVVACADGPTLLDRRRELGDRVRLLIVDIDLPRKSGTDCLRELRAAGDQTPALFITGGIEHDLAALVTAGTRVLRKPFNQEQLCAAVADALGPHAPSA